MRGRLDSCPSFAQVAREPRGFLPHHRELDTGTDQQLATNEFQQFPHEPAKDFGAVRPFELGKVGRRRVLRRQALLFRRVPKTVSSTDGVTGGNLLGLCRGAAGAACRTTTQQPVERGRPRWPQLRSRFRLLLLFYLFFRFVCTSACGGGRGRVTSQHRSADARSQPPDRLLGRGSGP